MNDISVCGADCAACYCRTANVCAGCNASKGVVFHCENGTECAIYHCCVTERGHKHCGECAKIPCGIWEKTRDPKFTDAEFAANTAERILRLKKIQ